MSLETVVLMVSRNLVFCHSIITDREGADSNSYAGYPPLDRTIFRNLKPAIGCNSVFSNFKGNMKSEVYFQILNDGA